MRKGLLMETASLGTRSPLRDLGAMGQGRKDRMQAASWFYQECRTHLCSQREETVAGDRMVASETEQSPAVSI